MNIKDIGKKVKDTASSVTSSIKDKFEDNELVNDKAIEKMKSALNVDTDSIKTVLEELEDSADLYYEAGFSLYGVSVSMGVPPKVTASLKYNEDVSEEKEKELLERVKDNKMQVMILKALFKAGNLQSSVSSDKLKMIGLSIQLGLLPAVTLDFNYVGSHAA